jgi:hypothetical protein
MNGIGKGKLLSTPTSYNYMMEKTPMNFDDYHGNVFFLLLLFFKKIKRRDKKDKYSYVQNMAVAIIFHAYMSNFYLKVTTESIITKIPKLDYLLSGFNYLF